MKRVALVTGGTRGLGLAAVQALAAEGMKVYLGSRSLKKGKEAAALLRGKGLDVEPLALDVAQEGSIRKAIARIEQEHGRLDVLVNNAGVFLDPTDAIPAGAGVGLRMRRRFAALRAKGQRAGRKFAKSVGIGKSRIPRRSEALGARSLLAVPEALIFESLDTNAFGALRVSREAIPLMLANGYGRIVNVSSQAARLSAMASDFPAYRISKVALNAITRILADELAGEGILVNAVCPGAVNTRMGNGTGRSPEESVDTLLWLATLPADGPTGAFYQDRQPLDW